jgi:hypothetical protein
MIQVRGKGVFQKDQSTTVPLQIALLRGKSDISLLRIENSHNSLNHTWNGIFDFRG